MFRGGTAWFSALVLLSLALPAGLAGLEITHEPDDHQEAVTPLFAPQIPADDGDAVTLERYDVEPRAEPIVPGTSVAIRAIVDTGDLEAPVEMEVRIAHSEGITHLSPAPQGAGSGGDAFVAAYWDAEGGGPFEVTGAIHVGDHTIPLPEESGTVEPHAWEDEPRGWVSLVVEGTLLWALVLGGLGAASRWARENDEG